MRPIITVCSLSLFWLASPCQKQVPRPQEAEPPLAPYAALASRTDLEIELERELELELELDRELELDEALPRHHPPLSKPGKG